MQADLTGSVLVDDMHAASILDVCQRLPLCIRMPGNLPGRLQTNFSGLLCSSGSLMIALLEVI